MYVTYHNSKVGYALLSLDDSIGDKRVVLGVQGKAIDVISISSKMFNDTYTKVGRWNSQDRCDILMPTLEGLALLLGKNSLPITKSAMERIDVIMDTRGKSTAQIREEVVRLSADLPKDHKLRDVPKFNDRGQAIAAYTMMRQTLFSLNNSKESIVAKTKEAPAKASKKVVEEAAAEPTTKAKKGSAKVEAKKAPAAEKPSKKASAANGGATTRDSTKLAGPFRLAGKALEANEVSELKLRAESARGVLMQWMLANKKQKQFTTEALDAVLVKAGKEGQLTQVLSGFIKPEYGYIEAV